MEGRYGRLLWWASSNAPPYMPRYVTVLNTETKSVYSVPLELVMQLVGLSADLRSLHFSRQEQAEILDCLMVVRALCLKHNLQ